MEETYTRMGDMRHLHNSILCKRDMHLSDFRYLIEYAYFPIDRLGLLVSMLCARESNDPGSIPSPSVEQSYITIGSVFNPSKFNVFVNVRV